jgi:hypothetical protein
MKHGKLEATKYKQMMKLFKQMQGGVKLQNELFSCDYRSKKTRGQPDNATSPSDNIYNNHKGTIQI